MRFKVQCLCAVMVLIILLSACNERGWGLEIQNATEISNIFKENEVQFCEAVDTLTPYTEKHYHITKSEEVPPYRAYELYQIEDIYVYTEKNQFLTDSDCQSIYKAVAPLFELCNIECIVGYLTGKIQIVLEEGWGQYAELYYDPNGGEIKPGFGVVDELRINEFWYAATSSD